MSDLKSIFEIAGGLALMLYGVHQSGVNLQKILGSYLENILEKGGNDPFRGVLTGASITAVLNSGGTTVVMLFGLVTGGILTLSQAVPVMLGANIGSTFATQLASLRVGHTALFFITAGVFIHLSASRKISKHLGEAIIGWGFLFMGMESLFAGFAHLAGSASFTYVIDLVFFGAPADAILAGILTTFILQSATATSILAVALGATSLIDLRSALLFVMGINLGSSLRVVYLALKGKNFSGKLAFVHLMFNVTGFLFFAAFFPYFMYVSQESAADGGRRIANAHTLYNLVSAFIFIPFIPAVTKASEKLSQAMRPLEKNRLFYLDRKLICTPSVSLAQANRAVTEMTRMTFGMLDLTKSIFFEDNIGALKDVERCEEEVDEMTEMITEYTIQISQQNLNHHDRLQTYSLMHILADLEHLADHILAVAIIFGKMRTEEGTGLSEKARSELTAVFGKLKIMQNLIIKSLDENNAHLAGEITRHENKVDEIIKKITSNHEKRIAEGICSPQAGRYFAEVLYNLERVGDHYDNIAFSIIDRFKHEERN